MIPDRKKSVARWNRWFGLCHVENVEGEAEATMTSITFLGIEVGQLV